MNDLIRRSEAQELLACFTEKNNLGHTPYQIVSNLPSAGPKWISCKERLPDQLKPVLLYFDRYSYSHDPPFRKTDISVAYVYEGSWHGTGCAGVRGIYWTELPEAPMKGVEEA